MAAFEGLPKDFFAFFRELKANNNRVWFEDNKQRYRDSVQAPLSAFVEAMAPEVRKISKHFICDPRPNGGSIFRIYRDIRFSKDKRPYKENAACHFHHASVRDVHAPGFYMHFSPTEIYFGGGSWMPDPVALAKIRGAIASKGASWKKIVGDRNFRRAFGELGGEGLTRPPRGFDPNHPLIEDIKRKSFFAMHEAEPRLAQSRALVGQVSASFRSASTLMRFLCGALGLPF